MLFLCYPKCSTCQKARKWLDEHGIKYTERHIAEKNPTYDELKAVDTNNSLLTFAELLDYAVAHNVILQVEDKIGPMESASNIDELFEKSV